jgi:hypothetical protein
MNPTVKSGVGPQCSGCSYIRDAVRSGLTEYLSILLVPSLKDGFDKLCIYTSDPDGIRHALLEQDSALSKPNSCLLFVPLSQNGLSLLSNKYMWFLQPSIIDNQFQWSKCGGL